MTARTIVEAERHENLEAFQKTFAKLEGITDEHVTALRRASTTRLGPAIPKAKTRSARQPTRPPLCAGLRKPWPRCKGTRRGR